MNNEEKGVDVMEAARKAEAEMLFRIADSKIHHKLKEPSVRRLEEIGETTQPPNESFYSGLKDAFSDD